jgi:hypothetical protein
MMAGQRKALSALIEPIPATVPVAPESAPAERPVHAVPAPTEPAASPAAPPARRPARQSARNSAEAQTPGVPKFRTLERKELYLRLDQIDELTSLRRRLNRMRGRGNGERLTENTLIRVAVDLLLSQAGKLGGIDEEELKNSLGL